MKNKLAIFSFLCSILALIFATQSTIFSSKLLQVISFLIVIFGTLVGFITSIISFFMIKKNKLEGMNWIIFSFIISGMILLLLLFTLLIHFSLIDFNPIGGDIW